MNNNEYWDRVKCLLKTQNKSQKELCEITGLNLGSFKGWLVKERLPDAEDSVKIAAALNTSVEYLVTGHEANLYKEKYDLLVKAIKELPI